MTHSQVVESCPHCGVRLPLIDGRALAKLFRVVLVVFGLLGVAYVAREVYRTAVATLGTGESASSPTSADAGGAAADAGGAAAEPAAAPDGAAPATDTSATTASGTPPSAEWQPRTLAEARRGLTAPEHAHRLSAIVWLGRHGGPADAPALLAGAGSENSEVRARSLDSLGRIFSTEKARQAAPQQVEAATRVMVARLHDSELAVEFAAAGGLAAMQARSAIDVLLAALEGTEPGRMAAASALGTLRERRAVPALIRLLEDEQTRWHAAQALGEIGGPAAEKVLLGALARKDYRIMTGAHAFYLRRGGPEMEPKMLDLLRESGDLGIAQTFILEGSPTLRKAAVTWAHAQGFTLTQTDVGPSWEQVGATSPP